MHEAASPDAGEIRSFVLETIQQVLNVEVDAVPTDDLYLGYGGMGIESLQLRELTLRLEERYGIGLPDDLEEARLLSLGDLVGAVADRARAAAT